MDKKILTFFINNHSIQSINYAKWWFRKEPCVAEASAKQYTESKCLVQFLSNPIHTECECYGCEWGYRCSSYPGSRQKVVTCTCACSISARVALIRGGENNHCLLAVPGISWVVNTPPPSGLPERKPTCTS